MLAKNRKKIILAAPVIMAAALLVLNYFSCSRDDSSSLFGNMQQSPLKSSSDSSKALEIQDAFRKIYDMYKDTVVFITTEQTVRVQPHPFFDDPFLREFFGSEARPMVEKRVGLGSGFIISEDGYICTNYHLIGGVSKVTVKVNEKEYKASVVGYDKKTDVALLKINPFGKLKPAYFGDSDKVRVGDWAIAIGNPFGLDKTFTVGVISAIGRRDTEGGSHIQTDASINPGNSGGPLINIYGEVIGINRMIYSQSGGYMGIGFAIPFNTARAILDQLKKHKKITRGYIGVSIVPIPEDYARELGLKAANGAFIGEVFPGSPALNSGIRVGDVILKVNDREVKDHNDLISLVGQAQVGNTLKLSVWRNRKVINIFVKVDERPE
ncbi:MAG: trypsin-like peptidase domain-containing protein [Spirochaetes bacterium]|jgi:Do/DeqQ family serine protease|nr:trypsin-like peptidase domain-containing protein [Spirochaetota bacterium]